MAMVDFFYRGEVNVYQENLDSFLVLAEELQLKGLRGNKTENETEVSSKPTKQKSQPKSPIYRSPSEQNPLSSLQKEILQVLNEKALTLSEEATKNTDMESLDQQVKSMMTFSEKADPYGRGKARICKVCGREGSCAQILNHIEAHHIAGISIPCDLCGTQFKSRNSLSKHKSVYHKSQ